MRRSRPWWPLAAFVAVVVPGAAIWVVASSGRIPVVIENRTGAELRDLNLITARGSRPIARIGTGRDVLIRVSREEAARLDLVYLLPDGRENSIGRYGADWSDLGHFDEVYIRIQDNATYIGCRDTWPRRWAVRVRRALGR